MKALVRLILLVGLTGAASAYADTAILKGMPRSFQVAVEPLDPDARAAGLSEGGLAQVIQGRLAKRRLAATAGNSEALPTVYARVVVLTSRDVAGQVLGYGAHIEVSCREKALLKRDKTTEFMAPVWFKGNVTVANPKQIVGNVVHALADLTDQFLGDYQRENPAR